MNFFDEVLKKTAEVGTKMTKAFEEAKNSELGVKAKEALEVGKQKAKETADKAKKMAKQTELELALKERKKMIGEVVYNAYKSGECGKEAVEALFVEVEALEKEIEEVKAEIEAMSAPDAEEVKINTLVDEMAEEAKEMETEAKTEE